MSTIRWRRETILDVYNLALGGFLFVAPWLFSYAYESGASGRLAEQRDRDGELARGPAGLLRMGGMGRASIVGLWVLASPWLLGFQHATAMPVNVAVGLRSPS